MLEKLAHVIVKRGKMIEKFFVIATVICAVCYPFVGVNYDLSKYLPDFAPTKQALDVMEEEFGYPGMARIMVKDVTLQEARTIRQQISDVEGVSLVVGPDEATNVYSTESFTSNGLTDKLYRDGNAVFQIIFEDGDSDESTHAAIDRIYEIVGKERGCFSGSAVSNKERQEAIAKEIAMAIVMAVFIIWLILTLTTTSWFEPFLFILVMAVAIILNMGSNLMFGKISFFTFSTAAILQLAVSMDYSIFLLHTYTAFKNSGMETEDAMEKALVEACSSILASGATTIVGFLVIALMQFKIGKDVGFVLTKGILCSLATVLLLMPTLILQFDKKIEKTAHRPFMPSSFDWFGKLMYRIRIPVLVVALLCAVPCYFGQSMNYFYYGDDALGSGPGTRVYEDSREIEKVFGKANVVIAIVPNGSTVTERELTKNLEDQEFVDYALSMSGTVPQGIPESFLPKNLVKELRSDKYARILISMKTREESEYSFACSEKLTGIVNRYYPEDSYVIGMTPTTIDIRDILTEDYNRVSIISLLGVAVVVMLTFRSVLVPILVIIPIEVAIYLNMTLPYIFGESMIYIGYIIVSCLQLGATIDYSILMSNNYMEMRETMENRQAAEAAISKSTLSILTSGSILTVVGYLLFFTSSIEAISQVGRLVGRGALLSMILVLSLLPALLACFDKQIRRQQERAAKRRERRRRRPMKMKHKWRKRGLCLTLAAFMAAGTGVEGLAKAGQPACDEALYVTLDPYGTVKEASVVKNYTLNSAGTVVDYGTYGEIHNMTDMTVPVVEGDRVTFKLAQMPEHGRFYFEGTLDPQETKEELPWELKVTYRLNGVEKDLEELAHEKGMVEIFIDAVPNEKASDYYKNNMTLEATAIVNMDENLSVEAPGAQIQSIGNRKAVLFMALPGEEQHFELRIGSDDFSFSGMMFLMVPVTLGQLDRLEDLREARDTVKDSVDAISDSLDVILDSLDGMEDSLAATVEGLSQLDKSRQIIHNSRDSVYVNADQALAVLKELSDRGIPFTGYMEDAQNALWDAHRDMNGLVDTVTGMDVDLEDINDSLWEVKNDLAGVSDLVSSSEGSLEEWENKLAKLKEDLEKLKAYQKQSQETLKTLKAFLASLKESAEHMDEYEEVLGITGEEYQKMKESIEALLGMELPDGVEAAEEIRYAVASFNNAIKDAVSGLPEGGISQAELKQMIEKLEKLLGSVGKPALMDQMIEEAEKTIAAMEQVILLARTEGRDVKDIINDSVDLVGALRGSTVTGRDMLEEVDDLRGTMNRYHNTALDAAEDAGLLIDSAVRGTEALYTLMNDVEGNLKAAGNPLNEGTRVTIDGLSQALEKAIDGLSRIGVIRDAKTTVTDLLDEKWEEYTGKDMTVLNADVNAKKLSFTSARNQEPESLQIILRTEGTEEIEETEAEVDETFHAQGSFMDRLWSVFKRIADTVLGLFS